MSTNTATEIEAVVAESLEEFGAEPDAINRDADFETLDIDSLDLAELAQIVEDKYSVKIKPEDMKTIKTVGDVVDFIAARV